MARAGEPPVLDVGPVERALLDPQSLQEAKVTARMRLVTSALDVRKIVDAQRAAGDDALRAKLADVATQAAFAAVVAVARQSSCSLLDAIGHSLRRDVEMDIAKRLVAALAPYGLGVEAIDGLSLAMDPSTETWLRAQRASARVVAAARRSPSTPAEEATAVAANCERCGTQVAADAASCPNCGAEVRAVPPCVACGAAIRPGSRFCVSCGARAFSVPRPPAR